MNESILTSIKKLLGISEEDESFDIDITMHINSVLMILNQIGIGVEGFSIKDKSSVWSDFIQNETKIEGTKTYVYLKVRLIFDPPISSIVVESMKQLAAEFEWRLQIPTNS